VHCVIITVDIFNNIFIQADISFTLLPENEEPPSPGKWSFSVLCSKCDARSSGTCRLR